MGNMELLCTQCRGIRPHLTSRGKSHCFSRVAAGTWGIFSSYGGDIHSKLLFVQQHQDSCLVTRDNSGISSRLGRAIQTVLEVRQETEGPFIVATVTLGLLPIFKKSQASSPFEALNSPWLSGCQRVVRPPVEIRWGPRAFTNIFTGDSEILSSGEMKDKPAFKPLLGNPAFF